MKLRQSLQKSWKPLLLGTAMGAVGLFVAGFRKPADPYFEIAKNIDIFGRVMREVSTNYVDDVEVNRFVRFGLDAMLKTLDPYTDFISASQIEEYRFLSSGQYGGTGLIAGIRDSSVIVTEIAPDSPAQQQGIQVGDRLLQIDKTILKNEALSEERLALLLSGQAKSTVSLTLQRLGQPQPYTVLVQRKDINTPTVDHSAIVGGDIAYVSLTAFAKDATADVRKALDQLRQQNPQYKGIILDLRQNGGGLLNEAIGLSNLFVSKGERIVETRGRMEGQLRVYEATQAPLDLETPLVVLMDDRSASASEIVAGVVQDLDRGVIVGRTSYGKGLVQTTRPLSYNAQIKITTARYYTPSGRCIQSLDYTHGDAAGGARRKADSLKQTFRTRRGRPVRDAGGIDPDLKVAAPARSELTKQLQSKGVIFDFATGFARSNAPAGDLAAFQLPAPAWEQFVAFVKQQGFQYQSPARRHLDSLRSRIKGEAVYASLLPQLDQLQASLVKEETNLFAAAKPEILELLRVEVVRRAHLRTGARIASMATDADVKAAIGLLHDQSRYQALLRPAK